MIHDPDEAAPRILAMLEEQAIITATGTRIPTRIDTICLHGDGPEALAIARGLRARLEAAGYALKPF